MIIERKGQNSFSEVKVGQCFIDGFNDISVKVTNKTDKDNAFCFNNDQLYHYHSGDIVKIINCKIVEL